MRNNEKFSLARIPGQHVPACVERALRRLYPTVRLVWNYHHQRWQLIERMRNGQWGDITLVNGSPTIQNTVGLLCEIDSAQMRTPAEIDAFLEKLDAEREAAKRAREVRFSDRIRPIGEALWDAAAGKIVVPMSGTRKPKPWQRRSLRR